MDSKNIKRSKDELMSNAVGICMSKSLSGADQKLPELLGNKLMKKAGCAIAIGIAVLAGAILLLVFVLGIRGDIRVGTACDVASGNVSAKISRHTVADRISAIVSKKPQLKSVVQTAGGKLRILVFKNERRLEVHAPGWSAPRVYPMTGFSGTLGPKQKEGDGQIPEGIYGIEYLNPNSNYYLSMKVSYPNATDRARAKADGRVNLGGDIMIHGKNVTIGCIPIGDDAIEDVFYLANAIGIKNVSVIIAPYDMRKGRKPGLEKSSLAWYTTLCGEIEAKLKEGK